MSKNSTIENLLENLSLENYGRSRKDGCCVQCGSIKVNEEDFKDSLSWKEYSLSRWCQVCQDAFFGSEMEDPEND